MWYHAGLQFEYKGFQSEAKSLAEKIDNGNILTLREKAEGVMQKENFRYLFSTYGFGQIPNLLPSIEEVNSSNERNSIIGQWLSYVLAKYLIPSPNSIGYNWRYISDALPLLGWSDTDINLLINGLPVGLLLEKPAETNRLINHNDPYWYWIRPSYSYNQGGFLSEENCEKVLYLLKRTQPLISGTDLIFPPNLPKDQEKNWKGFLTKGVLDAIGWIESAINQNMGIYSAIYWDWNEAEEEIV